MKISWEMEFAKDMDATITKYATMTTEIVVRILVFRQLMQRYVRNNQFCQYLAGWPNQFPNHNSFVIFASAV